MQHDFNGWGRVNLFCKVYGCSVQFSRSVVSDSLWPHGLQHARPPCPSPTPGVHPDPCPSSQWCHPAISSSAVPFSSLNRGPPGVQALALHALYLQASISLGPGWAWREKHPLYQSNWCHLWRVRAGQKDLVLLATVRAGRRQRNLCPLLLGPLWKAGQCNRGQCGADKRRPWMLFLTSYSKHFLCGTYQH